MTLKEKYNRMQADAKDFMEKGVNTKSEVANKIARAGNRYCNFYEGHIKPVDEFLRRDGARVGRNLSKGRFKF